ncbi:MAG: hypothetical protein ACJ757_11420 [Gaiellaceae bacterium]
MADERGRKSADADRDAARTERQQQDEIARTEREIMSHAHHLHEQGIIDLDAPAREVVQVIQSHFPGVQQKAADAADPTAALAAKGYWLVGDQGWCNHLQ